MASLTYLIAAYLVVGLALSLYYVALRQQIARLERDLARRGADDERPAPLPERG